MTKYFAQVNFTIETDSEEQATLTQEAVRSHIFRQFTDVVDANADEPVEYDEFGHAG